MNLSILYGFYTNLWTKGILFTLASFDVLNSSNRQKVRIAVYSDKIVNN